VSRSARLALAVCLALGSDACVIASVKTWDRYTGDGVEQQGAEDLVIHTEDVLANVSVETYDSWLSLFGPLVPVFPWGYPGRDRFRVKIELNRCTDDSAFHPESLRVRTASRVFAPQSVESGKKAVFRFENFPALRGPFAIEVDGLPRIEGVPFERKELWLPGCCVWERDSPFPEH
jgi:hypothetical protein